MSETPKEAAIGAAFDAEIAGQHEERRGGRLRTYFALTAGVVTVAALDSALSSIKTGVVWTSDDEPRGTQGTDHLSTDKFSGKASDVEVPTGQS